MKTLSSANRSMLHSLSWYMFARKTALRAACSFRVQLSVTDQDDMRVHYSGYFLNLLAATELVIETQTLQPNIFKAQLYSCLVFDGFPDGAENYSYLRELRNSIVHRGLNVTSAGHVYGNFPMILAEPEVRNQRGTKVHVAFDTYLLNLIFKCESVIGAVMLDFLTAAGIFESTIDPEAVAAEQQEAVRTSHAIPDEIKVLAAAVEFKPEWAVAAHEAAVKRLLDALAPCEPLVYAMA